LRTSHMRSCFPPLARPEGGHMTFVAFKVGDAASVLEWPTLVDWTAAAHAKIPLLHLFAAILAVGLIARLSHVRNGEPHQVTPLRATRIRLLALACRRALTDRRF
jgi:hypothetical protein